ncbi:hypothetical protein FJY68_10895 [candidate division WOR-3 bacterium]|uniref:Uncharacterized protein n=1 Tax=candidate division WOR-3 bacterium TaxID=2052148 RepID=A0A937XII7_UNCW3|nr:hypothetical protein [candidate division WOR-3 bacterium]
MRRTRLLAVLAIAVVAGLMVTGCERQGDLTQRVGVASTWIPNLQPATFTIWAGQNQNAGNVTVWFDQTKLYIKYQTTGNWWISETHAHAATSLGGIPQKNGNPSPGKFEFKNTFNPKVQTWTYAIPVKPGWVEGTELYIATHCVVSQLVGGKYVNEQTGWAGPHDFPGRNWAKYIKYRRYIKDVRLPDYVVRARVDEGSLPYFPPSTFTVSLTGITETFYDVWNYPDTSYPGWCAEHDKGILVFNGFNEYLTKLHSTENWMLPGYPDIHPDRWDNVNYLLNHKLPGATADDIQVAIWWLLTPEDPKLPLDHPLIGNAKTMHDEALLYGEGWHPIPGAGQVIGVFLDIQSMFFMGKPMPLRFDIQPVIIEVDP